LYAEAVKKEEQPLPSICPSHKHLAKTNHEVSVLIVDDNTSLLTTTALILKHEGYNVETARDGREAVSLIKDRRFDIILMDIKMPGENGVTILKKIKRQKYSASVILMTAYSSPPLIKEGLKSGAIDVLFKPLPLDRLFTLINEVQFRDQI
jgi:two-component system, NtrC family, response regulator HydG